MTVPTSLVRGVVVWGLLSSLAQANAQVVGPMVGQVGEAEARLLYRPGAMTKNLLLRVLDAGGAVVSAATASSEAEGDYVAHFHVTGLEPATRYSYRIDDLAGDGSTNLLAGGDDALRFTTALPAGRNGKFTAAFVSCADATSDPVWARMSAVGLDMLFLMGDTPYVDSSVLATVRQRHRDFLRTPSLAALIRQVPTVGTWDDHDFGLNNGNGLSFMAGKPITRQVFVEYRAHARYGTGTEGVYHQVGCGVMDVFLLDPRWFSQIEPSPVDPTQTTCFGAAQWAWLRDALRQSRAPFKVLALGAIWQDKKNAETDDMFTYWYERDALLDFIREEKIPGVVLLGGDIHLSRHLLHPQRVGYDLHDFVTSPAHTSTIPSLDVYNPDLEWSAVLDRQFLTLTVDTRVQPAVLTARYLRYDGTILHTVTVPYDQLVPKSGTGLGRDLRAWWSFDADGANQSALDARVDATAVNGAVLSAPGGVRGNAASFTRAASQYLLVPRSVLPENSARHTISLWCKPATLPAHGSAERSFLIETTPQGAASTSNEAYGVSLGFRSGLTSNTVNLQLYTFTLRPATNGAAPTTGPQGGFDTDLPRSLFLSQWTHVAFTFDRVQFRLFTNGQLAATHPLPIPGPISEAGGLILGGHRAGTGRNFDGQLDEVALWSRVLSDDEIAALHNGGAPEALPTATASVDSDGDTLPDWWELTHGLDPEDSGDAAAGDDGDGVAAFVEYDLGTSPLHPDAGFYQQLRQLAVPGQTPGPLVFRDPYDGKIRLQIGLESSTNSAQWTAVPLDSPGTGLAAAGNLLKLTLPSAPGPYRLFRFRAEERGE